MPYERGTPNRRYFRHFWGDRELLAEERLKGLTAEERLKGLSTEELLRALSPEARTALAQQLKTNKPSALRPS